MNYLDDYLKIIPEYDANAIRKALKENEKNLNIENISEYEFEKLVNQLAEKDGKAMSVPFIGDKIESETFNQVYSAIDIDLKRLFSKQESIEVANENYHHIYKATLDEITRAVETLRQHVDVLKYKNNKEAGLVIKQHSFNPENAIHFDETYNEDTKHLFVDRDGSQLKPAEVNRFYHNYSLTLKKKETVDILKNTNGISTAKVEILYQTPGTIENKNPNYNLQHIVDGSSETYWFNVCLKGNNELDKTNINPKGWGVV